MGKLRVDKVWAQLTNTRDQPPCQSPCLPPCRAPRPTPCRTTYGRTDDGLIDRVGARDTCVSQNGSYETWLLFRRTISHYPFFKRNMIAKMDHIIEFRSQCSSMQMTPSAHRLNFPKTHLRNRSDLNWAQFMELRWWASYAIVKQWSSVSGWEKYCWWTFLHQNETTISAIAEKICWEMTQNMHQPQIWWITHCVVR